MRSAVRTDGVGCFIRKISGWTTGPGHRRVAVGIVGLVRANANRFRARPESRLYEWKLVYDAVRAIATFSARTASPRCLSRAPAGSRASSRVASIAPRTTLAHGPRSWD